MLTKATNMHTKQTQLLVEITCALAHHPPVFIIEGATRIDDISWQPGNVKHGVRGGGWAHDENPHFLSTRVVGSSIFASTTTNGAATLGRVSNARFQKSKVE